MGRERPDLAGLFPLPPRGVCPPRHARRPGELGAAQGAVRGPLPPPPHHGRGIGPFRGHPPPQWARHRRPPWPGAAVVRAPPAANLAPMDGVAGQHHVDAIPGDRSRPDPRPDRPRVRLAFFRSRVGGSLRAGVERVAAGARELRRVPFQAPGVPAVLCLGQLDLAGRGPRIHEGSPRVRPRPVVQALRGRVP